MEEVSAMSSEPDLRRQELDLGIGIVGLHQTGGVHLDPLQVDALGANSLAA